MNSLSDPRGAGIGGSIVRASAGDARFTVDAECTDFGIHCAQTSAQVGSRFVLIMDGRGRCIVGYVDTLSQSACHRFVTNSNSRVITAAPIQVDRR